MRLSQEIKEPILLQELGLGHKTELSHSHWSDKDRQQYVFSTGHVELKKYYAS